MKRAVFLHTVLLVILLTSGVCLSQQVYFPDGKGHYSDKCEIAVLDAKSEKVSVLGSFKFLRSEGESGEAAFRLPGTTNYVVGWAGLDDESMRSPTEAYSVSMELMISKTKRRNTEKSLQYAFGEMLATSEMGRLVFSSHISGRRKAISMICQSLNPREQK